MDISLISIGSDNVVRFSLKNMGKSLSGPEEAIQLVSYALFTVQGSCFFSRGDGGGVTDLRKRNVYDRQTLRADAAVKIKSAMETIRRSQRQGRPANATVTALELIDVINDPENQKIFLKIRIRLRAGNSFSVLFEENT